MIAGIECVVFIASTNDVAGSGQCMYGIFFHYAIMWLVVQLYFSFTRL